MLLFEITLFQSEICSTEISSVLDFVATIGLRTCYTIDLDTLYFEQD